MGTSGATLTATFSGVNTSPYAPHTPRFVYGTSQNNLAYTAYSDATISSASGSFSASASSLSPSTTYYYKAVLTVWSSTQSQYIDIESSVGSFTTLASGTLPSRGYMDCYEMPAMAYSGTGSSGSETYGSTKWYSYETTSSTQKAVTHTYSYNNKVYRNYTTFMDKGKMAPLWCAFVMHKDAYPDKNVGRVGSWHQDPGFPSDWQQCSGEDGYSRGHFVASNYRQTTTDADKQTFYYTNQALQWQNSFNDGVWNTLENAVVSHAPTGRDTLYVVVGTLYKNNSTVGGVPLPSHFYKLLMRCSFNTSGAMTAASGCAYLFTNESHKGESYGSFITSIHAIEVETGFDFFPNVPDEYEVPAEASSSPIW